MTTLDIIRKTKAAWSALRDADAETKNRLLTAMADSLVEHTAEILTCNEADLEAARGRISDVCWTGCGWMRAASLLWRRVSGPR